VGEAKKRREKAGHLMARKQIEMNLKPVGFVRNGITDKSTRQKWEDVISEIIVNPELSEALDNLDEFSHIIVIFWTQRADKKNTPNKIRMQNNPGKPLVGLFATRSPDRPNPVAKTTVKLLERRGNTLKVQGLDAFDGTPVIDIKPFIPGYDSVDEAKIPAWVRMK
jgi:tRNA-Thr(GGU) m(6)t(6)A37 methyltransferase TsaA